jgi:hypothetical protein
MESDIEYNHEIESENDPTGSESLARDMANDPPDTSEECQRKEHEECFGEPCDCDCHDDEDNESA